MTGAAVFSGAQTLSFQCLCSGPDNLATPVITGCCCGWGVDRQPSHPFGRVNFVLHSPSSSFLCLSQCEKKREQGNVGL